MPNRGSIKAQIAALARRLWIVGAQFAPEEIDRVIAGEGESRLIVKERPSANRLRVLSSTD